MNTFSSYATFTKFKQVAQGQRLLTESQQVQSLKKVLFFPYMGMTVILVKFQAYGCNGFHRIIGPVNAYPRPSCHFFPYNLIYKIFAISVVCILMRSI